ncbi:MAG: SDR family oxidoreductase [bacterium]|nr:MAG: SDR family oxidoreductase [bacterium]
MDNIQKVLVTGGCGFIGSHLCKSLLEDGYQVTCFDNLITGSKKNIEDLLSNPNFEFVEADICQHLENIEELENVNYIFHLASPASPIDYQNHPEETLLVNSQGTLNILNLASKQKSKVLIASTSEIYGDPLEHPQKETYWGNVNTFGPRSCYDESKRFAETAVYVYLHKYDLDARIVRIFNTYGPNMQRDDGRVVSNFINWALKNEEIKIDGDGSQTRSFCYVTDLVDGIKKAMFFEDTKGEIFNLGNPDEFTISDLSKKVIELTNSTSEVIHSKEFRPDDPMQRCPDITKAKEILGWEPKVNLEEGLKNTIEYYKN